MSGIVEKKGKYLMLCDKLSEKITDGTYEVNTYLPPERKLSELYGVGRITVRNAIDIMVREGKIQKIQGAGNLVLPPEAAKSITRTIAFVISGDYGDKIHQPFVELLYHNMEQECRNNAFNLISVVLKKEDAILDFLHDKSSCTGIVFVGYIAEKFPNAAKASDMPCVLVSGTHEGLVSINPHNVDGCYDATEYLIKTGSKKIAFISGIAHHHNSMQRLTGYKRALLYNGYQYDESLVRAGDWDYESGYTAMQDLLRAHPGIDGVVTANDMMACGAIRAIVQAGRHIPNDVQVIGFDNVDQGKFNTPALSTMGVDSQFLAMLAIGLIENQIRGHKPTGSILIPAELVLRETTRSL